MSTLYDSNFQYDDTTAYEHQSQNAVTRRDLYVFRGSDAVFNCQAVDILKRPIDISSMEITGSLLEYENSITDYPVQFSKVVPEDGVYQILIDDTAKLNRQRYVYCVYARTGSDKIRIQHGQVLVE